MQQLTTCLVGTAVLLGSLACGTDARDVDTAIEGFGHAIASSACPGAGDPETYLFLTPEKRELPPFGVEMAKPNIYLSLASAHDNLAEVGSLALSDVAGWGTHCPDALREVTSRSGEKALAPFCDPVTGSVQVDRVEPDGTIIGSVALEVAGQELAGHLRAPWIDPSANCE